MDLRERPSPLVRDTVHHSGQVVTFLGSSASAAVNLDILEARLNSSVQTGRLEHAV